jgi:hypothetical protein
MDDFQILEQGAAGDMVWSMSTAMLDDAEFYHYLSVTPDVVGNVDVMTVIVASPDFFFESIEAAQDDVTLDGEGIFAEVDIDELQAIAEGGGTPASGRGDTGSTATAAGNVTISEVTGLEVEVNEPWVITDAQTFDEATETEEAFTIQSDLANGNIGFFVGSDAEASLNEFRDGFATTAQELEAVASDYSDSVAWSLNNAVLGDGTPVVLYIEVREDVDPEYLLLVAVLAEPENFEDEFTSAQESMSIDGEPVFTDVDYSDLEVLLTEGTAGGDDATAEAGAETTEGDLRRQNAKLPGSGGARDLDNETETGSGGQETGTIDFEDAGLISDNAYVSPQFDVEVTWADTWFIDQGDEESVTTDPANALDSLKLVWSGEDFALMFVDILPADGLTPEDYVTTWVSDDYLAENADPEAEILLERSRSGNGAVLMRDYLTDGDEVLIVKEAILLDGGETLAIVTLIATPDMYVAMYADAENDVEVNGGPALGTFTTRQIERAIDQ